MLALFACSMFVCAGANGQRPRFDDFFAPQGSTSVQPSVPTIPGNSSIITTPQVGIYPGSGIQPGQIVGGNPVLQAPNGLAPNQPFPVFPRVTQPPIQNFSPVNPPQFGNPAFQSPNLQSQGNFPALPQYQNPYGQPPDRSPYAGTGTNWQPSVNWAQDTWQSFQTEFLPRVLERPRVRQTYMPGASGNGLGINDIELATTATIPNFLRSNQPLRISPGFIFHYWQGPDSTVFPKYDLPARAYSAYLSFDHVTDPKKSAGLEGNFTIGYYGDFANTSSDAVRIGSKLLGWQRVNSYTVAKLGVEYFDRVSLKLLPAVGVYMTPNPDMKFDLYFPKTKLSHRIPNVGDFEVWSYAGAEYGGGSWAIERRFGKRDQADINDVRAYIGLEWMGPRRVTGFFEFGYVFDREIVYRSNSSGKLDLQDTLMIRSGLAF